MLNRTYRNVFGKTSLKLTMAVAVSWGMFLGASITGYASEEDPNLVPDASPEGGDENQQTPETTEENIGTSDNLMVSQLTNIAPVTEETPVETDDAVQTRMLAGAVNSELEQTPGGLLDDVQIEIPTEIDTSVLEQTAVAGDSSVQEQTAVAGDSSVQEQTPGQTDNAVQEQTPAAAESSMQQVADEGSQMVPVDLDGDQKQEEYKRVTLAILSDVHYMGEDQKPDGSEQLIEAASISELRLIEEVQATVDVALDQVVVTKPDVILVCGDLTSNGELDGAKAFAEKLNEVKQEPGMEEVGVYVMNGNHDINNSYAADFTGEQTNAADRIEPGDIRELYDGLGYGEEDHCVGGTREEYIPAEDDPSVSENHGVLSYATDISEDIRLIVIDTNIYSYEDIETTHYGDAQKTAGYVNEGLLNWATSQAQTAKEQGKLVLAMSHHPIMPHYSIQNDAIETYMKEVVVGNSYQVCTALADAGVSAILTGHTHSNDIAKFVSENGNVLYDIQLASLSAYPVAWRTLTIDIMGSGKDAVYEFSVETNYLDKDFDNEDTSRWTVAADGTVKDFNQDYDGSMQDYSYVKTGPRAEAMEPIVDYFVRPVLYDITREVDGDQNGLDTYLRKTLKVTESSDMGSYSMEKAIEALDQVNNVEKDVKLLGTDYKIKLTKSETKETSVVFDVTLSSSSSVETGKLTLDLSGLSGGVNEMIAFLDGKINEGDWQDSNYKASEIQKEINKLVAGAVVEALSQPLDNDPEVTYFDVTVDAMQAFARGDQGEEQTEERARWQQALRSDTFAAKIKNSLWNSVLALSQGGSDYAILKESLKKSIKPENTNIVTVDSTGSSLKLFGAVLGGMRTPGDLLTFVKMAGMNLIPDSAGKKIANMMADMQLAWTVDTNIPNDSDWEFHTVLFYPNDGTENVYRSTTIEGYRAARFPEVSLDGFTFAGWYTAEGVLVTADQDLSDIYRLYGGWSYNWDDEDWDDDWDNDDEEDDDDWEDEKDEFKKMVINEDDERVTVRDYLDYLDELINAFRRILNSNIAPSPSNNSPATGAPATGTPSGKQAGKQIIIPIADTTGKSGKGTTTGTTTGTVSEGKNVSTGIITIAPGEEGIIYNPYVVDNKIVDDSGNEITTSLFITPQGRLCVNLRYFNTLSPDLVRALDSYDMEIEIFYMKNGKLYSFIIPRGTKIARFADKSGFVGLMYLESVLKRS